VILRLIRRIPFVHGLEVEIIRLRKELEFERKVSSHYEKLTEQLTTHRDLLLSSLDHANRELTKLRARRNGGKGART